MAENYVNRDSFMNIKGTTCKSFTIGKTNVSFASSAVQDSDLSPEEFQKYKKLVVRNDGNKKIIYDMEIQGTDINYIEYPPGENSDPVFHLYNGKTFSISRNASGVQSSAVDTKSGELVLFDDTSGKVIKGSGVSILKGTEMPTYGQVIESIDQLNTAYENWEATDDKVPTMSAVVEYVGSINSILKLRTDGKLPSND